LSRLCARRGSIRTEVPGPKKGDTIERNCALFEGPFGRVYSFYMEHEPVSRLIARIVWGANVGPFYASMRVIDEVPPSGVIIDAPCGAGVAFRALRPEQDVRYLAVDLSSAMLRRARRRARKRSLPQIEFIEADAKAVPVPDAGADLFLSYFGLHCFPDPPVAVREIARCLRPGGRVVGGTIVCGPSLRQRLLVRPRRGAFGPVGTADDVAQWLQDAGIRDVTVECQGAFVYFSGSRA
jgi:SAM-dependent methyltransferase